MTQQQRKFAFCGKNSSSSAKRKCSSTPAVREVELSLTKKTSKRKYEEVDEELLESRRNYEQKLRRCEEELKAVDRFLSNNVVRERHFGDRRMKDYESTLKCVFCYAIGKHYSDACPRVTTVEERLKILDCTGVCSICISKHEEKPCQKTVCFYCKGGRMELRKKVDHHTSVCKRPEKFVEAQQKRWNTRASIDKYRRLLEECDAQIQAARQKRNGDEREQFYDQEFRYLIDSGIFSE
ncbi:hypothetical protein OSTOST_00789 [Ostertagia ostertagi]